MGTANRRQHRLPCPPGSLLTGFFPIPGVPPGGHIHRRRTISYSPLARDRLSLSRAILESVNHPSEATETPIEIQLSTLRTTLGDDLVQDLEDSVAPNTWRAYRSDLADFATSVAYTSAEWKAPEVVAAYLRTLEDGGAAYATITRRLTSIHKLVAIAAIAAGDLDYEDPTKHPRVRVTLQAIRRRLSTDQDQATPLTSQRLLQVLLSIDTATAAGIRDVALLLVGWYGALRRSELAGLERDHLSLDRDGLVLQLPRSKASPDHSVWVPIANQPDSDWNPTTRLEDWLEAAARLRPTATEAVWLHVTRGNTVTRDAPITAAAINNMVQRRARSAGLENASGYSAHSLRAGFVTEAKNRGIDEADIMRHTRHKSVQIMRRYDRTSGLWIRNATTGVSL